MCYGSLWRAELMLLLICSQRFIERLLLHNEQGSVKQDARFKFHVCDYRMVKRIYYILYKIKALQYNIPNMCINCVKDKYSKWSERLLRSLDEDLWKDWYQMSTSTLWGAVEAGGFERPVLRSPASNPFSTASRLEHTDYVWRKFTLVEVHPSSRHSSGAVTSQSIYVYTYKM